MQAVLLQSMNTLSVTLWAQAIRSVSPRIRTIAVVGNGPLSDLQRAQVAASDVVLRFNKLSNRRATPMSRLEVHQHRVCYKFYLLR